MHRVKLDALLSPENMIQRVAKIHAMIIQEVATDRAKAFNPRWVTRGGDLKLMTKIDEDAQDAFAVSIKKDFPNEVVTYGEETLHGSVDLTTETRPCILVDMIDGTDLLERGFSNWCSAIVIFTPASNRIDGAYVAMHLDLGVKNCMYYALGSASNACKIEYTQDASGVSLGTDIILKPALPKPLEEARICSYGQKSGNLLELLKLHNKHRFMQLLMANVQRQDEMSKARTASEVKFRFYNFAGNPMMARLADGVVDVVFDMKGQAPHDVVPGAFIAMKAGAALWDIKEGRLISDATSLVPNLVRPGSSPIKYVLAASQEMVTEMARVLAEEA